MVSVPNLNHSLNHSLEEPVLKGFKASAVLDFLLVLVSPLKLACLSPLKMLGEACSQHSLAAIVAKVCSAVATTLYKTLALK